MTTPHVQKILVTPNQANIWLNSNKINRKVRNYWVDELASQIKDGNWALTHQGIAFSKSGMLLDGQHRLMAIEKSKIPVEMFVCFNADDEIFKAIDSGIKRSMSDLTKLNRLDAEVSTRLCKMVFNGRNITPQKVLKIGETDFVKTHSRLMQYCSARARYYGAVNVRIAACLAIELGSGFDYVAKTYADLNRMDIQDLPPIASCLVKQVAMNTVQVNNNGDCLARSFKVFSEMNKNYTRLQVSDQDIKETYSKVKHVFMSNYQLGD